MRLHLSIAASLLAIATAASANEPPDPVVSVRYIASETNPEQLEQKLTTPLEKAFSKLDRVTDVHSSTSHGTVDVEIQFEGGTTEQDLAAVIDQLDQLELDDEVEVISLSVELLPPRLSFKPAQDLPAPKGPAEGDTRK